MNLSQQLPCNVLRYTQEELEQILGANKVYCAAVIPAESYVGQVEEVAIPTNEQLLSYVQGSAKPDTDLGVPLELRIKAQKALTGTAPLAVRGYWEAEFHCVGTNNYGRSPEERQALVDRYECGDFRGTVLKPRYAANAAALGSNMAATRAAAEGMYQ